MADRRLTKVRDLISVIGGACMILSSKIPTPGHGRLRTSCCNRRENAFRKTPGTNRIVSEGTPLSGTGTEIASNLPDMHARVVATQIGERAAAAAATVMAVDENRNAQKRSPERIVLKMYMFCKQYERPTTGQRMPVASATLDVQTTETETRDEIRIKRSDTE